MKKMIIRSVFSAVVVMAMAFSFAGCGGSVQNAGSIDSVESVDEAVSENSDESAYTATATGIDAGDSNTTVNLTYYDEEALENGKEQYLVHNSAGIRLDVNDVNNEGKYIKAIMEALTVSPEGLSTAVTKTNDGQKLLFEATDSSSEGKTLIIYLIYNGDDLGFSDNMFKLFIYQVAGSILDNQSQIYKEYSSIMFIPDDDDYVGEIMQSSGLGDEDGCSISADDLADLFVE